ncbi:MAG: hypothetical protein V4486_01575 [Patescibacteria group bacterium]
MKKWRGIVLVLLAVAAFGAIVYAAVKESLSPEAQARYAQEEADTTQGRINHIVRSIEYIEDARVGLCYAYFEDWRGGNLIPSIANVPCEKIPPNVLERMK